MMVAQMMGIHRAISPPLKALDPGLHINPQFMWFRIVYMDRFLSLMLGLPQGTSDKRMASEIALNNDTPTGRLQRIHAVIASRILERNERDNLSQDFAETQDIDAELLKAAKSMPDKFWLPPNFVGLEKNTQKAFWETMRLVDQIFHYSLLSLLHLPYSCSLPGSRNEHKYEYSKSTCVIASREILTRFVAFRSFNRIKSCCRPTDFFALLAAMMLVLAHLDSHRRARENNILAHQRLGDRAMMEQVLENMELVARLHEDAQTDKSAGLLRRLLLIEADAAQGNSYSTNAVPDSDGSQEIEDNVLYISMGYLGIIRIAPDGISCKKTAQSETLDVPTFGDRDAMGSTEWTQIANHKFPVGPGQHPAGKVPAPANQPNLSYLPVEPQAQSLPLELDYIPQTVQPHFSSPGDSMQRSYAHPNLAAGVDEWAFQGVDTAFFGSLMRGTDVPAGGEVIGSDWMSDWNEDLGGP
jgi:hypothetical protein